MKILSLIAVLAAVALAVPKQDLVARDDPDSRDRPEIPAIDDEEFISTVLNAHWYWRRVHCAQDLQWNLTLAEQARNDVRTCTKGVEHMISAAPRHRGGSNLSGTGPPKQSREEILDVSRNFVHGWHEEERFWDYATRNANTEKVNVYHFTQLVWRDSSQLGCAITDCTSVPDSSFPMRLYCYYNPIGNNVAGNYMAENVWPPVCADPSREELEERFGY